MQLFKRMMLPEATENMAYATHVSRMEQKDIERAFARLFSTEDGRKILAWLNLNTFQRAGTAASTDAQLRFSEGQRSLLATILRMIKRGRTQ